MDSKRESHRTDNETNRFYCSVKGCVFSEGMGKWFKRKILADQHYLNSHSEKKHICPKCSKPYSIDWQLKHHLKSCGLEWKCLSCHKIYKERLSLITHCKRHSHILPENAKIRKSKDVNEKFNTVSLNVIVMPLIIASPISEIKAVNCANRRLILPKPVVNNSVRKAVIQPETTKQCHSEDLKLQSTNDSCINKTNVVKSQIATQTEKCVNKVRASRSAQCPPVRRKRKGQTVTRCESTETQTLESILSFLGSQPLLTSSKSTSTTSPPKKSRTSVAVETFGNWQALESSSEDSSALTQSSNPLLSQFNVESNLEASSFVSGNSNVDSKPFTINEQSVQTDENKEYSFIDFTHIETQTTNDFINGTEFLDLNFNEDDILFTDLELNDIETQTIWNNDEMTQTDDIGDVFQAIDVQDVVNFFEGEAKSVQESERLFSSIETQTQTNTELSTLIPSYEQSFF